MFHRRRPVPEKLNICMIARSFPLFQKTVHHGSFWPIANGLAEKGHHVTILSWRNREGSELITRDNIEAYYLGTKRGSTLDHFPERIYNKFSAIHQKKPFDLVHSIDHYGYAVGRRKKQLDVSMVYNVEATRMSRIFSIMGLAQDNISSILKTALEVCFTYLKTYFGGDRKLLKTADSVFVTSPQQKLALERHYLFPEYHTHLVPYGIAAGALSPVEQSQSLREKLNLPMNARVVLTITDMQELSEMRHLLRAFERVAIKKPAAHLIVIGKGPFEKEIELEMLNLALGSRVHFVGAIDNTEISDYISLADAYVNLSSRASGFDPGLLEAMAQKKIVIGSEVSSLSTVVEDGTNGFLLRPADSSGLSDLLIRIFSDQIPAIQIGESARKTITDIFDIDKMVKQTEEAYRLTLASTKFHL